MTKLILVAVVFIFVIGLLYIRIKYLSYRNPNSDLLVELLLICCSNGAKKPKSRSEELELKNRIRNIIDW
jgi:hypothetical protein